MGARIEISVEEYDGLKSRINALENEIAISDKKIEELETKYNDTKDSLEYVVKGTTWLERTLQWKQIVKALKL